MRLTRRRLLSTATAAVIIGGVAGEIARGRGGADAAQPRPLGRQPSGLPPSQHEWQQGLARDEFGNPIAPRFNRLLMLDLRSPPTLDTAHTVEAALRSLERTFAWSHHGLLFTLSWGPAYFHSLGVASPVPPPEPLSATEAPTLDHFQACLHLASDDEARLAAVEAALVHGRPLSGPADMDLRDVFEWRETRTGFNGAGLPARHQTVGGIPSGDVVPRSAPLYMGFKSGLRRNQATEDSVTITSGPLAGGTTMHVSAMRLRLDSWYGLLDERDRVARMYAPQVTPAQAAAFTTDAPSDPEGFDRAARERGVVGHAQAMARVRRNGRPLILRRDFNTTDGGQAGLHFVSLQRSVADFVRTRRAMNASGAAYLNPAITETVNNGVNEFIFVERRANFVMPARRRRVFPLSEVELGG